MFLLPQKWSQSLFRRNKRVHLYLPRLLPLLVDKQALKTMLIILLLLTLNSKKQPRGASFL